MRDQEVAIAQGTDDPERFRKLVHLWRAKVYELMVQRVMDRHAWMEHDRKSVLQVSLWLPVDLKSRL